MVRDSGLPNHTDAMFTSVEGDWDEVMDVVKRAVDAVAAKAPRVSLVLKADIRPGVTDGLTAKVETPRASSPGLSAPCRRIERAGPGSSAGPAGICSISAARPASSSRSAGRSVRSCRT